MYLYMKEKFGKKQRYSQEKVGRDNRAGVIDSIDQQLGKNVMQLGESRSTIEKNVKVFESVKKVDTDISGKVNHGKPS